MLSKDLIPISSIDSLVGGQIYIMLAVQGWNNKILMSYVSVSGKPYGWSKERQEKKFVEITWLSHFGKTNVNNPNPVSCFLWSLGVAPYPQKYSSLSGRCLMFRFSGIAKIIMEDIVRRQDLGDYCKLAEFIPVGLEPENQVNLEHRL